VHQSSSIPRPEHRISSVLTFWLAPSWTPLLYRIHLKRDPSDGEKGSQKRSNVLSFLPISPEFSGDTVVRERSATWESRKRASSPFLKIPGHFGNTEAKGQSCPVLRNKIGARVQSVDKYRS
jgi:hypothetical protein